MGSGNMIAYNLTDADRDEFRNLSINLEYALAQMAHHQKIALFLYYWQRRNVREIANTFCISWDRADRLIDDSFAELRHQLFIADHLKEANGY
jgi:DNA-directed RNA polymerase specialized sigma24 family protein